MIVLLGCEGVAWAAPFLRILRKIIPKREEEALGYELIKFFACVFRMVIPKRLKVKIRYENNGRFQENLT